MRWLIPLLLIANTATAEEATGKGAELAFVLDLFRDLNPKSIRQNAEYCGYLGKSDTGKYLRTAHAKGTEAGCRLPRWPRTFTVIASYHTHSTYSTEYESEIPSALDFESDRANEIDGYIATPGGRLWFLDSDSQIARQVCGIGCLPADPNFVPDPPGTIKEAYHYNAILAGEGG